jgi:ABC-type transport system involved in cytochrome bd biosynthesis fused ATPase/permease subunit
MSSLGYWAQLARTREAQARVADLLGLPNNPAFSANGQASVAQVSRGQLQVTAKTLLAAPLTLAPGEVVHLATQAPPQTSRLLSAIAGMTLDPEIEVKVDAQPLNTFSCDRYRDSVVLVSRHLALVPGTILDNLTLYNPAYHAAARDWCEKLGLQPYLDKLHHGILTEVGPGTAEHLDEGLYQRIALIRALLRQPRILLLDHAATGIDLDGVKRLAAILQELQGNTTVLIATYKETLIEACTRSVEVRA